MKIKCIKQIIVIILATFVLMLVMCPLRAIAFKVSSLVASGIYFVVYLFYVKKFGEKLSLEKILYAMLFGAFALDVASRIHYACISLFTESLVSLLDVAIHFISIVLAYLFCKWKGNKRFVLLVVAVCIPVYVYFEGYDLYLHYYRYGSLPEKIEMAVSFPEELVLVEGESEKLPEDCRYVLLYCWSEYCGVCINKFPQLQELHDNCPPHCRLYSVYCGTEERWSQNASRYVEGFDFPVLLFTKDWKIERPNGFPRVFVLDVKRQQAVYSGDLKYGWRFLKSLSNKGD